MTLRKKIIRTVQIALLLGMLGFGFYPRVSDAWNRYVADRQISHYTQTVQQKADTRELEKTRDEARSYNKKLFESGTNHIAEFTERIQEQDDKNGNGDGLSLGQSEDPEYESILNIASDGQMGSIDIDKINVHLPIYHDTTDEVLARGIGHLYGSSLPVGGKNTRTVLTGHRGLPSMKLFTDLDRLKNGDTFEIHVLGQTLTYEVENVDVIRPENLAELNIEPGKDLVSLVTCTPYGVNTHRLVVTGRRTKTHASDAKKTHLTAGEVVRAPVFIMLCAAAVIIGAAVFLVWVWTRKTLTDEAER